MNLKAVFFVVTCTVFTAIGQLLWKFSSDSFAFSLTGIFLNYYLLLGFISYGAGFLLLILALRDTALSRLYPLISLTFIWVAFLSLFFLREAISMYNWFGIGAIVVGVAFLAGGS